MEHRFVTPTDGFVRAIAICRQRLLDCSAEAVMCALIERGVKQNGSVEVGVTQVRWTNLILMQFFFPILIPTRRQSYGEVSILKFSYTHSHINEPHPNDEERIKTRNSFELNIFIYHLRLNFNSKTLVL